MGSQHAPSGRARRAGTFELAGARPPRDRRLVLARAAWLVSALLIVGLFVASVPVYFEYLRTQCFSVACPAGPDFTPDPQEMEAFGLSVDFYAAYFVAIESSFTLVYVALAAFVFWRRSDEWPALLGAFTLLVWGTTFTNPQAALAEVHPGWWFPVACLTYVGSVSFVAFFCLFPDGRFVPGWTRWLVLGWAALSLFTSFFLHTAFGPANWPPSLVVGVFVGGLGGPVVAQVYRYRRVSGRVERQQTKLVVFGIAAAVAGFLGSLVLGLIVAPSLQNSPLGGLAGITAIYLFLLLVPLSISLAILRYGLWEIDIVINRTLVYGALTAIVVGLYVLVVGVLGALLEAEGNLLISLLAAGLVAVLFAPLRNRLQRGVNRLMYGERDEPYAVLSRLGQRLEGTLEPEAVLPVVVETVAQALKLPYAAITLKENGGHDEFSVAAAWGSPVDSPVRLPLVYQHETVGQLVLAPRTPDETFGPADLLLLNDLARQAGIAAHAVLLTADLQRARERLVTAREEERRRLRRDLHDGLGPQLSSQTLTIDAIRALLRQDPDTAEALLLDLKTQAQDAVADIRRLVYGLRPPALDDLGLVDALRETAEQHGAKGLSISVDAPEKLLPLPAAVEVAAYLIAQEAITNVVRHAEAKACAVSLVIDRDASTLYLEVRDDGRGLSDPQASPPVRSGVGLTSMRERAAELGGSLTVEPIPEGGTSVRARLPLPKEE